MTGRPLAPCGTQSAYSRHIAKGEKPDDACREAHRQARNAQRAVARAKNPPAQHAFPAITTPEQVREHMEIRNACWEWTGKRNREGYGRWGGKFAHRVSYEVFKGPIPAGFHVDHLCFNPPCVRPDHLQAVEPLVNLRRNMKALAAECSRGHKFTPENTARVEKGRRRCRKCHSERGKRNYQERKAARMAVNLETEENNR